MAEVHERDNPAEARLAAIRLPEEEAGWARAARAAALARLRRTGLPNQRDEYWRETDPSAFVAPEPVPAAPLVTDEPPVFDAIDRLKVVFVDGVFDPEASDPLALDHVEIERLADVLQADIHWARDLFGRLEETAHDPVPRPFAALNTAVAGDGIVIRVRGRAPKPISLIYLHRDDRSDAVLHHLVRIEPGAELTLLENGPAAARFNQLLEVEVAAGGSFHHVRAQGRDHERRAVTHLVGRVAEGGVLKSFTLTANGALSRNEYVVRLEGAEAVTHLAGAAVGDGAVHPFHHDDTIFVTHAAESCESRQVFKKVLRNGAVGVFQGKILVRSVAQKTDGYQLSQGLMLDGDSRFFAKPELEIYADDVKCSHGSTCGAIDEEQLFYLRARGVPRPEAENLLVLAFLAEALEEIEDPALADDIRARLEAWLRRRQG